MNVVPDTMMTKRTIRNFFILFQLFLWIISGYKVQFIWILKCYITPEITYIIHTLKSGRNLLLLFKDVKPGSSRPGAIGPGIIPGDMHHGKIIQSATAGGLRITPVDARHKVPAVAIIKIASPLSLGAGLIPSRRHKPGKHGIGHFRPVNPKGIQIDFVPGLLIGIAIAAAGPHPEFADGDKNLPRRGNG